MKKILFSLLLTCLFYCVAAQRPMGQVPAGSPPFITRPDGRQLSLHSIDSMVKKLMDTAGVTGLCLGMVQDNQVAYVQAYGYKNKPLQQLADTATCFYGASFSKAVFAYLVMHLVDQGLIDLDKPLYTYLPKPLPEYNNYKDLAGDDRWKLLTVRQCLDHTTGFPNWRFFNQVHKNKLEFFFTPGTRYAYSGEGIALAQLVVETVTGRPLDSLAQQYIFTPFGMRRTSYLWQPSFDSDYAVGHLQDGQAIGKNKRTRANAAGSMETTIADYSRFLAAVVQGKGISANAWKEMTSPQITIYSKRGFPTLDTETTSENQKIGLAYGLGWGLMKSPYGKVFFKEGHDDGWENFSMCLPEQKRAIVILTNSSNGESIFKELIEGLTGVTIAWEWESYWPYKGTVTLSPDVLLQYAGNYVGKFNVYFTVDSGRLMAQSADANLSPSRAYAVNDHQFFFKMIDADIDFMRGPDGRVNKVSVNDEGERYDLIRVRDTTLSPDQLSRLEGTYDAGKGHVIIVSLHKGNLYAEDKNPGDHFPKMELHPYSPNEFYMKEANLKIRFVLDGQGRPGKLVTFGSAAPPADWVKVMPATE